MRDDILGCTGKERNMKKLLQPFNFLFLFVFCFIANSFILIYRIPWSLMVLIPLLFFIIVGGSVFLLKTGKIRLRILYHGAVLLCIFTLSLLFSVAYHIVLAIVLLPQNYKLLLWSILLCFVLETTLLVISIVCLYCTSVQLGIRLRVIGAVCGMIPLLNLIVLGKILMTVMNEIEFETQKEQLNQARKEQQICKTKYPILLVHGLFLRDSKYINYWGRIPKELKNNGATVFYGEHQSALSVADSAKELSDRIRKIIEETGCEKLNIIAHSKGGLDCRYAISELEIAPYVASLTTVSTPHRGCLFADRLLYFAPRRLKERIAKMYNNTMKKFGDTTPDFMAAVNDLTAMACAEFNMDWTVPEGIYCQSVGSRLNKAAGGRFPMNLAYQFVTYFDGDNDGLVGEFSFKWGEDYQLITVPGKRGVSHSDMIDMNRENIKDFDVREFYVQLVHALKERGL